MNRLKALYRSWAIACTGNEVYAATLSHGVARQDQRGRRPARAEHYYQQLRPLRQEVRLDLLVEARKHKAWKLLSKSLSVPIASCLAQLGPAILIARIVGFCVA